MGGDWNCTVDCRNVDLNIDVLNMAGIPSKLRSEKVKNIFTKYKLADPYRYFYPNKREFTYIPANLDATNRSRLDIFGVSENLVTKIGSCGISNPLTNPSFDHKEIFISFKKDRPYPKNKQVQNHSIKNKYVKIQVKTAAIECYLQPPKRGSDGRRCHHPRKNVFSNPDKGKGGFRQIRNFIRALLQHRKNGTSPNRKN